MAVLVYRASIDGISAVFLKNNLLESLTVK